MKTVVLLVSLALPAVACAQETLADKMVRLEQNQNSLNAMMAAQKGRLENLQLSVDTLSAKVDAIAKAQGVNLASKTDWAGDATWSASGGTSPRAAMWGSAYSASSYSTSAKSGMFGRLRAAPRMLPRLRGC